MKVKQKLGTSLMFMLENLAHLALSIFFQFAVVILHSDQSTSIEIYDWVSFDKIQRPCKDKEAV